MKFFKVFEILHQRFKPMPLPTHLEKDEQKKDDKLNVWVENNDCLTLPMAGRQETDFSGK